jgi:hypothetical protein
MKNTYQVLYGISIILFILVIIGGSITKPIFNNFSTRTLETAGVKKSAIDSVDSRIDDLVYNVTKVQLQIEKLKNIFFDKEIDESKFQRQENKVFTRNIYNPLNEILVVFFRIGFFFISVIMLMSGVIVHLVYRSGDLRRRVDMLEKAIYQ